MSIHFNPSSYNATNSLTKSSQALDKAMSRLTSGLRINNSSDDAAGFQIANRMFSQIRGMAVAVRNSNDAVSMIQTAEGGLKESTEILQRMRDLSAQAASDTNTGVDREALQSELSELVKEFDRIGSTTSFNGKTLLNGTLTSNSFQIGANAGENILFSIDSAKAADVGKIARATGAAVTAATSTDITLKVGSGAVMAVGSSANYAHATDTTYRGADSAFAKAAALNASESSVVATATTTRTTADVSAKATQTATGASSYVLSINGTSIMNKSLIATETVTIGEVVSAVNSKANDTGVTASFDSATNKITMTAADGRNVTLTETAGGSGVATLFSASGDFAASGTVNRGTITMTANETITIGGTVATIGHAASINRDNSGLDAINISTKTGAETALLRIDSAIQSVDKSRASMGSMQNRFDSVINNLRNASENASASRSRIMDADFAKEAAEMAKQQILQQSSIAMISQANQNSQLVLSLLR